MKKLVTSTVDIALAIVYQICRAFLLWYMYRNEMPGIPDVETWLCK